MHGQWRPHLVAILTVAGLLIVVGTASALALYHRNAEPLSSRLPESATTGPASTGPSVTPADVLLRPGVNAGVPDDVDRKTARKLARAVEAAAREGEPVTFRVVSFNVLGASHTTAGGNKPRYADGTTRMNWAVDALRAAQADVVGFQEYEPVQNSAFQRITGGTWGVFPGSALGNNAIRNSIAWNGKVWTVLDQRTIPIPYFRGTRVPMPYVLLEHKETGRQVWFINIHNPVSNKRRGNNEHWRDVATAMEINLVRQLSRDGTPVILTGDFNERSEAFCKVTAGADAVAANGGTVSPCRLPANAGIDWIFGTGVAFSDYVRLSTPLISRASDHPLIAATVTAPAPKP
jgi:endonuclease/exonuclease/phosphatase family metal-dependent hydrolase